MDDLVTGDRVVLRRFRPDDADELVAACNDPMVQRFLSHLPQPYTYDDALSWINQGSGQAFASGGAAYAIADRATDALLGGAGMGYNRSGVGELGYWVAPAARGRGVATAAAKLLAAHAFAQGFRRLTLRTAPENTNSQRVALGAGFTRESVQRGGHRTPQGEPADMIVWARLAEDQDEPTPRRLPDLPGYDGARAGGKLTDGVVTLRPLIAADAEDTFLLRQLDDVVRTSVPPHRPDFDEILALCERAESLWLAGQRADFTIRDSASGGFAGEVMLLYNEPQLQQAVIGYSIAPAWRRHGYATRAVRLVSEWTFANTDVVRLFAGTAPDNVGSQRVLRAAGFAQEGLARKRVPGADGTRIDDVVTCCSPQAPEGGRSVWRPVGLAAGRGSVGEPDDAVVVRAPPVDDARTTGVLVLEQVEVVSDQLHLEQGVLDGHRHAGVLLHPDDVPGLVVALGRHRFPLGDRDGGPDWAARFEVGEGGRRLGDGDGGVATAVDPTAVGRAT